MFPKYYELVITAIIIYFNIAGISSFPDSIYSNKSYGNTLSVLRRIERQAESDTCVIPSAQFHTNYTILGELGPTYKPGDNVPNFTILKITCDAGFKLSPFAQNHSVCLEGIWASEVTNCMRSCPSLKPSISTNVSCTYNDSPLDDCYDPVEGTTVMVSCNPLYEDSAKDQNLGNICLDGIWEPPVSQCNPICGQKRPLGRVNIINGIDTLRGNYPWHVGIYNASDHSYSCGGAIIASNIVLSVAHCFTDYYGNITSPQSFTVAAGKYYRIYDHNSDEYAQYSKISKINIPERYRGYTTVQALDIAVLILENPFSLSSAVQPVCIELNEQLQQLHLTSHSVGIVTGWGKTEEGGELADRLKELEIPHIPYHKCFDELPREFKQYYTRDKICGGYKNNTTGVCGGDSGGALVYNNWVTDRFYIKGVVSTSPAIAGTQICDSNQYSLYTSIVDHIPFIRNVVIQNNLRYSVACKYDKCTKTEPQEVGVVEEMHEDAKLIEYVREVEEVVKSLKEQFSKSRSGVDIDDLCGALTKCSCMYVLFSNSSDTAGNLHSAVREIIQKVDPNYKIEETNNERDQIRCLLGSLCYELTATLFKVPQEGKELLKDAAKLIQDESSNQRIDLDIFEDHGKCSYNTLLKQLSGKMKKLLKVFGENANLINIKYGNIK